MAPRRPIKALVCTPVSLCVVLALSACALPKPLRERPTAPVPPAWSSVVSVEQPAPLADWWERFGDPLLTRLITRAVEVNTEVVSAQARLRQARSARDLAAAAGRLKLTPGTSVQNTRGTDGSVTRVFRAGLDASWEPDLFGATRRGVEAGEADFQASAAALASTQVLIAAEVAIAYVQLRGTQARLTIARANLASQQEALQITRWRVQAGLTSSLDVERSLAAVAQTEAQIPVLEAGIATSQHSLSVLIAEPPASLQAELDEVLPTPVPPPEVSLGIPAVVLRQRPDVRAMEWQLEASAARVGHAKSSRWPTLPVTASLIWNAITLGSLGTGTGALPLAVSTAVPLLDGGTGAAQVQEQRAQFDAAQSSYRATVLAALQEVEDVLANLAAARTRLEALRRAAQAANHAALLANNRYTSGLIDFSSVLETQRTLLSAQDNVASTEADLAVEHVRLYKALGGGWVLPAAPNTQPPRKGES